MSTPIFCTPNIVHGNTTTFQKVGEKVIVSAPGKLIKDLVALCDGVRTRDQIVSILEKKWDKDSLADLLNELYSSGVIVESTTLASSTWEAVKNPSRFLTPLKEADVAGLVQAARLRHKHKPHTARLHSAATTALSAMLDSRSSTRSFTKRKVDLQQIVNVLWNAYGETSSGNRTVPSAGALYPLTLHLALFHGVKGLRKGIYRVHLPEFGKVGFTLESKETHDLIRTYLDPLMAENAQGAIVVSGLFGISGQKYGNRSVLYVTLEAGHVAQNIHLAAAECGLSTVEVGGFIDDGMRDALRLQHGSYPLTSILFGYEDKMEQDTTVELEWVCPVTAEYKLPFTMALARIAGSHNRDWSYGRDTSSVLAKTKAESEAREWAACGCIHPDNVVSSYKDLPNAIDPKEIICFHPAQYRVKGFPLVPFDYGKRYEWVRGKNYFTDENVYVFADHVYFPYFPETEAYAFANSSGVAAHPDRQQALMTSVLELVERDAFILAYMTKLQFPTIRKTSLPEDIQKRIHELERIGVNVCIKDHTLDLAPVVSVFAQSSKLTYMTCAACSKFDVVQAVSHALMEVEASVLARLQNGPAKPICPVAVSMPADHGAIYESPHHYRRADFMVQGGKEIPLGYAARKAARTWDELLCVLQKKSWELITIPLFLDEKYGGNKNLYIVRSIVPGMIPMTFGYRQEPAGMERVYRIAREYSRKNLRYSDIPKFPHPFA